MSVTLTICGQALGGAPVSTFSLTLPAERMTVRELIRERVYQEVSDRNAGRSCLLQHVGDWLVGENRASLPNVRYGSDRSFLSCSNFCRSSSGVSQTRLPKASTLSCERHSSSTSAV